MSRVALSLSLLVSGGYKIWDARLYVRKCVTKLEIIYSQNVFINKIVIQITPIK